MEDRELVAVVLRVPDLRVVERELEPLRRRRGGTAGAIGGAKLDAGAWPAAAGACCADSVDSQAIPEFMGKTRGIGAYDA